MGVNTGVYLIWGREENAREKKKRSGGADDGLFGRKSSNPLWSDYGGGETHDCRSLRLLT